MSSSDFCQIFNNTDFYRTPLVAAFVVSYLSEVII